MVIPCIDMKIILIGAGNLATRLAVALQKKGMTPAYIYSRTRESAEQLSERLHDVPHSTDISQVPTDGDLYIFAVKDSALLDLVSRMPSNRGLWVHTAGSMDMEVFAPYTARYGVFYPMQTFSKERETDFDDIPIFVEANHTDDTERLQELAGRTAQVPAFGCRVRLQLHQSPLRLVRPHSVGTRAAVRNHAAAHTGDCRESSRHAAGTSSDRTGNPIRQKRHRQANGSAFRPDHAADLRPDEPEYSRNQ